MLALIIVVCITAITALGTNANNTFTYVGTRSASASSKPRARGWHGSKLTFIHQLRERAVHA